VHLDATILAVRECQMARWSDAFANPRHKHSSTPSDSMSNKWIPGGKPVSGRLGRSPLPLSAWGALCCLGGCSLQGFEYLSKGGPRQSGGSTGQATNTPGGGTEGTSTAAVGGAGDAGGATSTGGATNDAGGATGAGGATNDADAGTSTGGAGGACGGICSLANATSATCAQGKCSLACGPNFADCNSDTLNDGCEVYLNSLTGCGTDCTNGVACPANQVCNAGQCVAAMGIVVLSVPFTAAGQVQRYADKFLAQPNLTDDTLIFRLYAPGATGGTFAAFITDLDFSYSEMHNFALTSMSAGWTDVSVPVGGVSGSFDPSIVYQVTIHIVADGDVSMAAPTVVYIDSIRTARGSVSDTFDTSFGNVVGSQLQVVEGSKLTWLSAMP
jgi:hypothetical protein